MLTDIEKLIERLHSVTTETASDQAAVDEAGDALKDLTVGPLPEEVVEAIRCCTEETRAITFAECARLLESQAREVGRLAAENAEHVMYRAALATEAKEIGDENDRLRTALNDERENCTDNGDPMLIDILRAELETAKLDAKKGG